MLLLAATTSGALVVGVDIKPRFYVIWLQLKFDLDILLDCSKIAVFYSC